LTPELLFEVGPGLNWENASVCLLAKEVLRPLRSMSILEEGEGPEDFFLITGELLWGQAQIQHAGVKESLSRALFAREVWGEGSFGLACCLDRVARAEERGLTRGGDIRIGGKATVDVGTELVISWVICCNWVVRAARVVFIACSEVFCRSVSSWRWYCR